MQNGSLHPIPLTIALLLAACGPSAEERAPTIVAQTAAANQAATAAVGQALAIALTENAPPPSETPTPTITLTPTETPTPTNTPNPVAEVIEETATIREGPGQNYSIIETVEIGTELEIIGRSEDGDWLAVFVSEEQNGWVLARSVSHTINLENLVVLVSPPTPNAKITITIVNNLDVKISFFIIEENINVKVPSGEIRVITLAPGTYYVGYSLATQVSCGRALHTFVADIYWAPQSPQNFCTLP
jgi:uncharacterized protein YgiM (DUF1202 family)